MKNKILFNGVLYEESDNAKTGYEVDTDTQSHFWYIDHTLNSHRGCRDNISETIDAYVRVGNYFNSEKLCTNIAYIQTFYNCLRQWQALNDKPITTADWNDPNFSKHYITLEVTQDGYRPTVVATRCFRDFNQVYFSSADKAHEALIEFQNMIPSLYSCITRLNE